MAHVLCESNVLEQVGNLEQILKGILDGDIILDSFMIKYVEENYGIKKDTGIAMLSVYITPWEERNAIRIKHHFKLMVEMLKNVKCCMITRTYQQIIHIVFYDYQDVTELERAIRYKYPLQYEGGIAMGWFSVSDIHEMKETYNEMYSYFDWNISFGDDVMISYPKVKQIKITPCIYPKQMEKKIKNALCNKNIGQVEQIFEEFREYFISDKVYSPQSIKECYMKFFLFVISISQTLGALPRTFSLQKVLEKIIQARTNWEIKQIQNSVLEKMSFELKDKSDNRVIRKMLSMIHDTYCDGITLNEIATKLNMTPEYIGTLFYKEMGIHFSTYMKKYRVEKAKVMLLNTQLKQYEIAERTGFSNAKYFSRVFKEVTGKLPAEYRRG